MDYVLKIISQLVDDYTHRGFLPLRVGNILSIFTHPEVTEWRLIALLWLNNNDCTTEEIIVRDTLTGYLIVYNPQSKTNTMRFLLP